MHFLPAHSVRQKFHCASVTGRVEKEEGGLVAACQEQPERVPSKGGCVCIIEAEHAHTRPGGPVGV